VVGDVVAEKNLVFALVARAKEVVEAAHSGHLYVWQAKAAGNFVNRLGREVADARLRGVEDLQQVGRVVAVEGNRVGASLADIGLGSGHGFLVGENRRMLRNAVWQV
jgi:hypothetical protein